MAFMIPDSMPSGSSKGEKRVFDLLQNLPNQCIVYYEPIIANRYPDFIVILPHVGVLIIEVKGWYIREIEEADPNGDGKQVIVKGVREKHPAEQAREYKFKLMDCCKKHKACKCLLHKNGNRTGQFKFPFAHMVVLSNIEEEQLKNSSLGDLRQIFPDTNTIYRDQLLDLCDRTLSEKQWADFFSQYLNPRFSIEGGALTDEDITALRAVIHPDIKIPSKPKPQVKPKEKVEQEPTPPPTQEPVEDSDMLKIIDVEQEQIVRNMGNGHRLLWGVAGSGKTIMLIARAKLLAEKQKDSAILLTCFNMTLAAYLKNCLADCPNVDVEHFHSIASKRWNLKLKDHDSDEKYDAALEAALDQKQGKYRKKYAAILVDEAQDFHPAWIKALLDLAEDPLDGDFFIAGDGNQGIFKSKACSWKSIGIKARGRTLKLKKNYRNSSEIVALAAPFSVGIEDTDDGVDSILLDPKNAVRSTGIKPLLLQASNDQSMVDTLVSLVKELLQGSFNGRKLPAALKPEEIGILYPAKINRQYNSILFSLVGKLSKLDKSVLWLDSQRTKAKICDPGIKVLTIHSSKGLQFKAVFLFGADILPRTDIDTTTDEEKKLLYVGLTRPEDFLIVCNAGRPSEFIDQITKMKDVADLISIPR